MEHFFFIHSSIDGHFGCFHVLAIVKTTAAKLLQPVPSRLWSSEVRGSAVGLLNGMLAQFLLLNAALFVLIIGSYHITSHQQLEGTRFSKTPSAFIVCRLLADGT